MGLVYPQSTDDSFNEIEQKRLTGGVNQIVAQERQELREQCKRLREQCTKANERADKTEYWLQCHKSETHSYREAVRQMLSLLDGDSFTPARIATAKSVGEKVLNQWK